MTKHTLYDLPEIMTIDLIIITIIIIIETSGQRTLPFHSQPQPTQR